MIRAAIAVVVLFSSVRVHADPATADRLADVANDLAGKGQFKDAAAKFAEAYREDARPELFCNVGISYFKAEQWARAHLLLKLCVDRAALAGLDPKYIDAAGPVIASIEDTMRAGGHAQVAVRVTPNTSAVTIADWAKEETFVGERVVWLPLGTFRLTARSEGYVEQTVTVTVDNPTKQDVVIEMKKPGADVPKPPPPRVSTTTRPSIVPPLITTGITVAAAVLLVIAKSKASDAAEFAQLALTRDAFDESKEEVDRWNTVTSASGTVVVLGAGASTYLWIRVFRHTDPPLEVAPTTGGAAVTFRGRF